MSAAVELSLALLECLLLLLLSIRLSFLLESLLSLLRSSSPRALIESARGAGARAQ